MKHRRINGKISVYVETLKYLKKDCKEFLSKNGSLFSHFSGFCLSAIWNSYSTFTHLQNAATEILRKISSLNQCRVLDNWYLKALQIQKDIEKSEKDPNFEMTNPLVDLSKNPDTKVEVICVQKNQFSKLSVLVKFG